MISTIKAGWRIVRSWFGWKTVWESDGWIYWENTVTKDRRITRKYLAGDGIPGPPDVLWKYGHPRGETYRRMHQPIPPITPHQKG